MKNGKTYLVEYQAIRQVETACIPKRGKTRCKRRQIKSQFMLFYNAICALLEFERKQVKQQPK